MPSVCPINRVGGRYNLSNSLIVLLNYAPLSRNESS